MSPATIVARLILLVFWITSGLALITWLLGNRDLVVLICAAGGGIAFLMILLGAYATAKARSINSR